MINYSNFFPSKIIIRFLAIKLKGNYIPVVPKSAV